MDKSVAQKFMIVMSMLIAVFATVFVCGNIVNGGITADGYRRPIPKTNYAVSYTDSSIDGTAVISPSDVSATDVTRFEGNVMIVEFIDDVEETTEATSATTDSDYDVDEEFLYMTTVTTKGTASKRTTATAVTAKTTAKKTNGATTAVTAARPISTSTTRVTAASTVRTTTTTTVNYYYYTTAAPITTTSTAATTTTAPTTTTTTPTTTAASTLGDAIGAAVSVNQTTAADYSYNTTTSAVRVTSDTEGSTMESESVIALG